MWFFFRFITWEQRKFSELANTRRGLTYSPTNIAEKGVRVLRSSNINEDVFTLSEDDVFVCQNAVNIEYVHEHEILITAANGSTRLVGKHAIIIGIPEKSAVHGGFMLIAAAKSPVFLNASMSAPWYAKFISLFVAGGNGAIGNLNKNDLDGQNVYVPLETEQIRIGEFFKQLDNLITLHQRKQNDKFLLFEPKNYANFLANSWEQRKLGEVGKAQSGVGFPDREQGGKTGVPFYKVSDMNNAGNEHEMCSANNYVSEAQCKKNGWMPITEISVVFAKVGAAIMLNRKRLVRISFLLDNNTMAYKFGTEWDIDFGKTLFERIDLTDLVQIGALPSYNATDVECVEISMPDKPEQHRIGVFFKQLDNLITLHQRQLEKLKNIKSALLEKMFV